MRELFEEIGYESSEWISPGNFRVDGNHGAGMAHLYLVPEAQYVTETQSDHLEEQLLHHLDQTDIEAALVYGEFQVQAWKTIVALAIHYLQDEAPISSS